MIRNEILPQTHPFSTSYSVRLQETNATYSNIVIVKEVALAVAKSRFIYNLTVDFGVMPSTPPFIDQTTGQFDTDQIIKESIPLSKLIAAIGVIALVPFGIATTFGLFEGLLVLLTQFVLAVGSGVVLLYVITRAIQLAEE